MAPVDVVIGILLHNHKVLICQRPDEGPLGGLWEFPGGKLERDESLEHCLRRELREELSIEVCPTEPLASIDYTYRTTRVRLHPYLCRLLGGEPQALSCQQFRWIEVGELSAFRFPPANEQLIRYLLDRFSGRAMLGDGAGPTRTTAH